MAPDQALAEEVGNVASFCEQIAKQVRQVDDKSTFHIWTLDFGVTEEYTFGDILDVIALGLRGAIDGHSGRWVDRPARPSEGSG